MYSSMIQRAARLMAFFVALVVAACATPDAAYRMEGSGVSTTSKVGAEENLKQAVEASHLGAGITDKNLILISSTPPVYPRTALRKGEEGTVTLQFVVGTDGAVKYVSVLHSAGAILDQACVDALKTWRFAPVTRDGAPIQVMAEMSFPFHITP